MIRPTHDGSSRTRWPATALALVAAAGFALAQGCAKKQIVEEEKKPEAEKPAAQAQAQPQAPAAETPAQKLEEEMKIETIYFDFDKANIRPGDAGILKHNAKVLKGGKFKSVRVTIEGHCDERGSAEYNMALGERRARATFDYLHRLGIAKNRLKTVSYGKERPADPAHTEEAWAKNRRCEFVPET